MTETLPVDVALRDLLDVQEMMKFTSDGFVRLDRAVPHELNEHVLSELDAYEGSGYKYWDTSATIRRVFQLPRLCGALRSLVGPDPVYNHSFVHIVPPNYLQAQDWHADAVIDTRPLRFDVLVMYFPQDTPQEMGPTLVLPGLAPARHPFWIDRSLPEHRGPAAPRPARPGQSSSLTRTFGTVPSRTRLTASVICSRCGCNWPRDANSGPGSTPRATATPTSSRPIFTTQQPWYGAEHREVQIERAKLWRYLCGDDHIDAAHGMLTRLGILGSHLRAPLQDIVR